MTVLILAWKLQAGVAEADAVILRMPLESLAANDADAQVIANIIGFTKTANNAHPYKPTLYRQMTVTTVTVPPGGIDYKCSLW